MISALWSQFEGQSIENSFRLTRLIGVGGFGGVFLGDHVVEGHFVRRVAVKLIESQPESFERQLGELITATTLQHPHLLRRSDVTPVLIRSSLTATEASRTVFL